MARRHGKLRARAESRCRKRALALTCAGSPPAALRFVASMYGAGAASVERSRRARAAVSVTARYRALPSISYRVSATGSTAWRLRITGIPTDLWPGCRDGADGSWDSPAGRGWRISGCPYARSPMTVRSLDPRGVWAPRRAGVGLRSRTSGRTVDLEIEPGSPIRVGFHL